MENYDLRYPTAVHIETWAKCNAACVFCPYPIIPRKGEKMPDELIEKILKDLEDIPDDWKWFLSPFKVNEPFLDKRLIPMLEDVNERHPNAGIRLFSNGSPMTADKIDQVARLKNVEHLWISLNDHRPDVYEDVMKIPMAKTLKRLDVLHERKSDGKFPHRVVLSKVADGTVDDLRFEGFVSGKYPEFEPFLIKRDSWIDFHDHAAIRKEVPKTKCGRWYEIDITATGVVSLCCMDGRCEYPIGDVSKDHVLDVFNAPHYRQMRTGDKPRQVYSPCNRCSY